MCWKFPLLVRVSSVLALVGAAASIGVANYIETDDIWGGAMLVGLAIIFWFVTLERPSLCVGEENITIVNPVRRHSIHLTEVTGIGSSYGGIIISRNNKRSVTAWAVQKPNWAYVLRRRVRSDEVVDEISQLVQNAKYHAGESRG
jgi:hypothetical protein